MTSTIVPITCTDSRCGGTGLTWCPGCNGWGVMRRNGKRIRQGRDTSKWPLTNDLPEHHECNGSGQLACGCLPLDAEMQATLAGTMSAVEMRRWSTVADNFVTVGIPAETPSPVELPDLDAGLIAELMGTDDLAWITHIPRDPNGSGHIVELPKPSAGEQAERLLGHKLVMPYKDSSQRKYVRLSPLGKTVRGHAFAVKRNAPAKATPAKAKATVPASKDQPSWANVTAVAFSLDDAREIASRLGKDVRDTLLHNVTFGGVVVSDMSKSTVANMTVHRPLLDTEAKRGRLALTPLGKTVRAIVRGAVPAEIGAKGGPNMPV